LSAGGSAAAASGEFATRQTVSTHKRRRIIG
jgi:hypothetical protein